MSKLLISFVILLMLLNQAIACTAVNIEAKDKAIIAGRTMEWAFPMQWQFVYYPKGTEYQITAPSSLHLRPIKVVNKYAVFGIGTALAQDVLIEGQNAAGLGLSGNFLPAFTQYQTVTEDDGKYLSILEFSKFVLGNFATVREVKTELPNYKVWEATTSSLPVVPYIHFLISDKTGDAVIIEFVDGKMKFFEHNTRVMTNAPNYDWHMINIRDYLNLSNNFGKKYTNQVGGVTEMSQGTATLGLPGGYTSPSRFIKTTFLKHYANTARSANEAVQLVGHILNNVDIPKGVVTAHHEHKSVSDYTQWLTIKDLSHNQLYFADYDHRLTYVKLDLNKIFTQESTFILPIDRINYPTNDITNNLSH